MALFSEANAELLHDFIDESLEALNTIDELFIRLEAHPDDLKVVEGIFRPIHSMKGNAAYFGLMRLKDLAHRMESLLDLVRQGRRRTDRRLATLLLRGLDGLRAILHRVRDVQEEVAREDDFLPLLVDLEAEAQRGGEEPEAGLLSERSQADAVVVVDEPAPRSPKEPASRTMRISEENVDRFLDQVGELIGLEELFRFLGKRMVEAGVSEEFTTEMRQATEQFAHLSSSLSKAVMELRRTEARPLLQKVPRLARDVAQLTGKDIAIRTLGEDVRLDKSYLQLLDAPLMHMVRNACDHGIDTPEERRRAGKSETGSVEVAMLELEDSFVLQVTDDGRGLNMEGLRNKAVELGIHRAEAPFGEVEAVAVLFHSGVSTASSVTEISGRGVGLDVVKREIEGAGGRIEVTTTAGKGSCFRVVLPRSITTRIADGFLFRCGQERYVLPMRSVVETFPVAVAQEAQVAGGGKVLRYRDEVLRLVEGAELLEQDASPEAGVFVRIRAKDTTCVLRVDEVLGVQRTVIKPLEHFCNGGGVFAGAAMLGDGRLAMVLGEEGLVEWLGR